MLIFWYTLSNCLVQTIGRSWGQHMKTSLMWFWSSTWNRCPMRLMGSKKQKYVPPKTHTRKIKSCVVEFNQTICFNKVNVMKDLVNLKYTYITHVYTTSKTLFSKLCLMHCKIKSQTCSFFKFNFHY